MAAARVCSSACWTHGLHDGPDKGQRKGIVNFCLNYGSHAELTDATRAIAAEVKAGTLEPEAIDEKVI